MAQVRTMAAKAAVAALCVVAAGCTTAGGPSATPSASPSSSAPADEQPVTLRFAVYGEPDQLAAYEDLAQAFSKYNPHVTVELEKHATSAAVSASVDRGAGQAGGPSGRRSGEAAESEAGEGAPPDVFVAAHDDVPALVAAGSVQPVDGLLGERQVDFGDGYQRDGLEAFSSMAALQCMPHDVSPMVVYYNRDLVDFQALVEEGEEPPNAEDGWDWEQFAALARRAARGPVKGVHLEPELEHLVPFLWSAGASVVDDSQSPTTLTLSGGDSRAALEQVLALLRDPQITPTRQELAQEGAVARFADGRLAMLVGTREVTPRLRQADVPFDVFPLPSLGRYRTITDMTGYCISAETDHVQAAADFLAFAVSREGATITATAGYVVPSNLEVAHSPAFTQPGSPPENSFVFTEGVRRSERTPFVPEWSQVEEAVQPLMSRMLYAPVIDLDLLLEEIDAESQTIFPQVEEESPSPR